MASLLDTGSSFKLPVQNHAEFVSIQTVDALAHNSRVAIGKIDAGHSLIQVLGIETVVPADALHRLRLQDEVRSNWL